MPEKPSDTPDSSNQTEAFLRPATMGATLLAVIISGGITWVVAVKTYGADVDALEGRVLSMGADISRIHEQVKAERRDFVKTEVESLVTEHFSIIKTLDASLQAVRADVDSLEAEVNSLVQSEPTMLGGPEELRMKSLVDASMPKTGGMSNTGDAGRDINQIGTQVLTKIDPEEVARQKARERRIEDRQKYFDNLEIWKADADGLLGSVQIANTNLKDVSIRMEAVRENDDVVTGKKLMQITKGKVGTILEQMDILTDEYRQKGIVLTDTWVRTRTEREANLAERYKQDSPVGKDVVRAYDYLAGTHTMFMNSIKESIDTEYLRRLKAAPPL